LTNPTNAERHPGSLVPILPFPVHLPLHTPKSFRLWMQAPPSIVFSSCNIPDFRGRFLRGRDGGAGIDPDRNSRTAMKPGGAVGDLVGSVQDQSVQSHNHGYKDIYHSENGGNGAIFTNGKGSGDTDNDNEPYEISRTSDSTGGNETRPKNANVNYIIKL
jgi:hypothetical protein